MSDLKLTSLSLTAEYMGIDSENHLFRILPEFFTNKIETTVYNWRRRRLMNSTNTLRLQLSELFNEFENYFIVDSIPLEACKISRSIRSKDCKDVEFSFPDRGFCVSQKVSFYGYKLHAQCSVNGVFQSMDPSAASVHDIHYLEDIQHQLSDWILIGDKGYLFETANIRLETPKKKHQKRSITNSLIIS